MTSPQPMYCRTCRHALNTRQAGPGAPLHYLHAAELRGQSVDHQPDPVPLTVLGAAALMVCDLCSTPRPSYVYTCDDQDINVDRVTRSVVDRADYRDRHYAARIRRVETEPVATQRWGQRWACCDNCAVFIESDDIYGLIRRVTDSMPAKYTRGRRLVTVRAQLHATYRHLLDTRQPGRGVITPDHPLGLWADDQKDPRP